MDFLHDLNTKKTMKNAFRITKNKYMTAVRIRVPGGSIYTDTLKLVADLADKYGDGRIHITTRQGFEVLARKIEDMVYPDDLHVKIAATGCPNDCIKARMHDIGIIGMCLPIYDSYRCISCGACVKKCKQVSTTALSAKNYKVVRDQSKCIGCGECVLACPNNAWVRSPKKYYRIVIMGRTGKTNPRIAEDFIKWADEDTVLKVIDNTYK